jgi:hypothetical protein
MEGKGSLLTQKKLCTKLKKGNILYQCLRIQKRLDLTRI